MNARWFVPVLFFATALAFTACGDDDGSSDKTPGTQATQAGGGSSTSGGGATATGGGSGSGGGATTAGGSSGSATGKLPDDACSLLSMDQVRTVLPQSEDGKSKKEAAGATQVVTCFWQDRTTSLTVTASSIPAPATTALMKTSLQAEIRNAGANGGEVQGVGDYAIYTSTIAADMAAKAVVKGYLLVVDLNGLGARDQKDKVIALLKAAAGRIQ